MIFECANCGDTEPYRKENNGKHLCYYCFNAEKDTKEVKKEDE